MLPSSALFTVASFPLEKHSSLLLPIFFVKKLVFFKHERDSHARSYERDWMKWNGMITRLKGKDNFRKSPSMTTHEWQTRMINLAHEW